MKAEDLQRALELAQYVRDVRGNVPPMNTKTDLILLAEYVIALAAERELLLRDGRKLVAQMEGLARTMNDLGLPSDPVRLPTERAAYWLQTWKAALDAQRKEES